MKEINLSKEVESRFSPEFLKLIRLIAQLADAQKQEAVIVGGVVRDLLLNRPLVDMDVMLTPPVQPLVLALADQLPAKVQKHETFLTFTLNLPSGKKIDLATAREETYSTPGRLPQVTPSTIERDLKRRDFTINAMAIRINAAKFGVLLDPFNGKKDLAEGLVRTLHPLSFHDDPTRIFRAARFSGRFGFSLDLETSKQVIDAGTNNWPVLLTPVRRRHEFELILREEDPLPILQRLVDWNMLLYLHPSWEIRPEHRDYLKKIPTRSRGDAGYLTERLVQWFKPFGREKTEQMMMELQFERSIKKVVLKEI